MHLLFGLGKRLRDVQGMMLQLLSDMQRMRRAGSSAASGDGGDVRRLEQQLHDLEQTVDSRLDRIEAALVDLTAAVGAKPQSHVGDEAVKSVPGDPSFSVRK